MVAAGGMVGASARYGLVRLAGHAPWGTFGVNLSGSFALGLVLALLAGRHADDLLLTFLGPGVLGAYTTYSALAVDTDLLLRAGRVPLALGYALLSAALGPVAALAGLTVGRR